MKKTFLLIAICLFRTCLLAQTPQLVADINPGATNSWIGNSISFNGKLIFAVDSAAKNEIEQLWITDGSVSGTHFLKDFLPLGGGPAGYTVMNGKVYFIAADSSHGSELWVTDGTISGTTMVKDIRTGSVGSIGSSANALATLRGKLFFAANDSLHGKELWVSDGTDIGTHIVIDIDTTFGVSSLSGEVVAANNKIFFSVNDGTNKNGLWISDGIASGVPITATLGGVRASVYNLIASGNKVYFTERVSNQNPSVPPAIAFYVSDGTQTGTIALNKNGLQNSLSYAEAGGKLYFYADSFNFNFIPNPGLWVTDGTVSGTILLKNLLAVNCGSFSIISFNNKLYFGSTGATNANELWVSDGTAAGTTSMIDFSSIGISAPQPADLVVNGNQLYFRAWDSVSQRINIWLSDGTITGTHIVDYPGANSYYRSDDACSWITSPITLVDSTLYFGINYDTVTTGFELYRLSRPNSVPNLSLSKNNFTVFPNPTHGSYTINAPVSGLFYIYSIDGRLISTEQAKAGRSEHEFSANLATGVYVGRFVAEDPNGYWEKMVRMMYE